MGRQVLVSEQREWKRGLRSSPRGRLRRGRGVFPEVTRCFVLTTSSPPSSAKMLLSDPLCLRSQHDVVRHARAGTTQYDLELEDDVRHPMGSEVFYVDPHESPPRGRFYTCPSTANYPFPISLYNALIGVFDAGMSVAYHFSLVVVRSLQIL
ncbi:hypothetical protein B296_00004395 [Ensete ventricosum]|uniref:Uncharacterized protein n=1 Tax=Ensete ventricosum TaxID=4639 RepID=A0A427AU19_ENSVE|nr:hypothetical protein B296_00004395 [Ensete ventricosum]